MKIVCENCGAKYSIADEKVKGKVFKIRCKKCSESILVRGDTKKPAPAPQPEPAPQPQAGAQAPVDDDGEAETKVFDYSGYQPGGDAGAIWHIVVDDEQQGPYPQSKIAQLISAGTIGPDSLIWREGFDDWVIVSDTAEFAKLVSVPSAPSPQTAGPAVAAASRGGLFDETPEGAAPGRLFDEQPSGGLFGGGKPDADTSSPFDAGGGLFGDSGASGTETGDVFSSTGASAAALGGGGLFGSGAGAAREETGGGDLFASAPAASEVDTGNEGIFSATKEPEVAAAPSPRVSAQQAMMTGQRNENSVLFSLSNLQALAAAPAEQPKGVFDLGAMGGGASVPAGGQSEASGLIDIRSLAGSLATAEQDNSVDDLISMSAGGFSPALGAPILAAQSEGMSAGTKYGIIGGAVGVLAIVVVLVVVLTGGDDQEAANAQMEALRQQIAELTKNNASGGNEAAIAKLKAELAEKRKESGEGEQPGEVASKTSGSESAESSSKGSSSSKKPTTKKSSRTSGKGSSSKGGDDQASVASSEPAESAPPAKKGGVVSELDDLLGGATAKRTPKPKSTTPSTQPSGGSSGAPKASLSRADVQKGMGAVAPAVKRCGQGKGGTITMAVMIGKTGRVSSASATGAFAGTPIGSCAARAVRRAKFPASQQTLNVKYPFKL